MLTIDSLPQSPISNAPEIGRFDRARKGCSRDNPTARCMNSERDRMVNRDRKRKRDTGPLQLNWVVVHESTVANVEMGSGRVAS